MPTGKVEWFDELKGYGFIPDTPARTSSCTAAGSRAD